MPPTEVEETARPKPRPRPKEEPKEEQKKETNIVVQIMDDFAESRRPSLGQMLRDKDPDDLTEEVTGMFVMLYSDYEDFVHIAKLIRMGDKAGAVEYIWNQMDTSPRESLPESIYEYLDLNSRLYSRASK